MVKHFKFSALLILVFGLTWIGTLFALSGGAPAGYNGTNLEGGSVITRTCTTAGGCHSTAGAPAGAVGVGISGLPAEWTPNTVYPLTVTVAKASVSRFGFQLSAVVDATSAQPAGGGLAAVSTNVGILAGTNGVLYADQVDPTEASPGIGTFTLNWTSPSSAAVGAIRFNIVGMGAGGPAGQTTADDAAATAVVVSPVTPDITPPTVSITAPAASATVSGTITISANANDAVGVVGVQFKVNSNDQGAEDTSAPYSVSWNTTTVANGTYTLTAVARDAAGNSSSASVPVTVNNGDTIVPTVSMTAPAGGSTVSGAAVALSANASDNVGVAGVQFKVNGVNQGSEDTSAPYSITWNTTLIANGTYTITATARDAAGNLATSAGVTVTVSNAAGSTRAYSITGTAGNSLRTDGTGNLTVGYSRIQSSGGTNTPAGVVIFGLTENNVLTAEGGVPASPLITQGRIYAEVSGVQGTALSVNTGLAIANPNGVSAVINFYFTNSAGTVFGTSSVTIPANQQLAKFIDQSPFSSGVFGIGTLTFTSNVPVSAIALRTFYNENRQFLFTTLPVANLGAAPTTTTAYLALFADGGGWQTRVVLANPTNTALTGSIEFWGKGTVNSPGSTTPGALISLTAATSNSATPTTASTFAYSIPAQSAFKLTTLGLFPTLTNGSVRIVPSGGTSTPTANLVFAFRPGGVVLSEAGVPATKANVLRLYAEVAGADGSIGSIQTGVAIASTGSTGTVLTFDLFALDGTAVGTVTKDLPGNGLISLFVNELFTNIPVPFKGVLRISGGPASGITVVGVRTRYNQLQSFLVTTTPATDEGAAPGATEMVFPHFVNGGGYTTQVILFSGTGATSTGQLMFVTDGGAPLTLGLNP